MVGQETSHLLFQTPWVSAQLCPRNHSISGGVIISLSVVWYLSSLDVELAHRGKEASRTGKERSQWRDRYLGG